VSSYPHHNCGHSSTTAAAATTTTTAARAIAAATVRTRRTTVAVTTTEDTATTTLTTTKPAARCRLSRAAQVLLYTRETRPCVYHKVLTSRYTAGSKCPHRCCVSCEYQPPASLRMPQ